MALTNQQCPPEANYIGPQRNRSAIRVFECRIWKYRKAVSPRGEKPLLSVRCGSNDACE